MPRMALLILILLVGCKAPNWQAQLNGALDRNGNETINVTVTIQGN